MHTVKLKLNTRLNTNLNTHSLRDASCQHPSSSLIWLDSSCVSCWRRIYSYWTRAQFNCRKVSHHRGNYTVGWIIFRLHYSAFERVKLGL